MDEADAAGADRRRPLGRRRRRRRGRRACAGCRSPTSATPSSTTTARCARACPRRCTGRARRPSSACASSASCSPTAPGRCCSRGPTTSRSRRCVAVARRRPCSSAGACCGASPTDAARRARRWSSPPAPPTLPVADECVRHARAPTASTPTGSHDVGVAGLHRLLAHLDRVTAADAVVVVAGMEGALASVIGGLTGAPVVAVPTSVGYGVGARRRHRAAGDARLVRQRRHRRRHRQRLRRGRAPVAPDAAPR